MSFTPGTSTTNRTRRSRGFTLIELLAVMLILAILMTLVVGAAKLIFNHVYTEETKTNMKIIMTAIAEYREIKLTYPPDQATLVEELSTVVKSRAQIGKLPDTVWNADTVENKAKFLDAWGNAIRYTPSGGLAGAPELTSGGPDGDLSTEEDNVRYNK